MHRANIILHHPRAEVIERTVRPESLEKIPRTAIEIARQDDRMSLLIESQDVNALRAAINSYLRWMDMAARIAERIGD